jgi:hypothetical protein
MYWRDAEWAIAASMGKIGEATMAPNGLTATQWLLIAFFILLATVIAFEVMQDLAVNQRSMRAS